MSMIEDNDREDIPMKCHNCGHEWYYSGQSDRYVSCPSCHYKVNKEKQRLDTNEEVRGPEEEEEDPFSLRKGETKEIKEDLEVERARFTNKYYIRSENKIRDISKNEWEDLRDTATKEEIPLENLLDELMENSETPFQKIIQKLKNINTSRSLSNFQIKEGPK